ncbi:MAG TPA: sigma-70 family RNA polymerase sigma factor [Chthonomonadaceae bacterium]|nr:sigma-70 family RNA polymerase sigma factor [Chthonomonadaceae bacterium]
MTSIAMAQTPPEVTDETLAKAAQAGDTTAFAALAARYREVAYAYAYACLRNRDEAEDTVQEAFVRIYQALGRFRSSECWGAWTMRIVRNLCTDALRRRRRKNFPLEEASEVSDRGPSPEQFMLASARTRELNAAIAALPEKYRIPLLMHYGSGRTYREIALALGLSESTIGGRLAGALRLLRRRLRQEEIR